MGLPSLRRSFLEFLLPLLVVLAAALPSSAQTLTTDQLDYPPGATAILTGTGFAPNEVVRMQVTNITGQGDGDWDPWWINADANGEFVTNWLVCEEECVGATMRADADGEESLLHAETIFTDANCVFFGGGTIGAGGVVPLDATSCLGFLASTNSNINTVGGHDYWLVREGGSYQVSIDNVSECAGNQITVIVYSDVANGFSLCDSTTCFTADRVAGTNTFTGTLTVPDPNGGKHYFYYKCGAGASCDAFGAYRVRGPSSTTTNCRGVGIRLQNFDAACNPLGFDECCTEPQLLGVPQDVTVECGSVPPPAQGVTAVQSCEQCFAGPVILTETSTQGAPGTCAFTSYTILRTWTSTDTCGNVTAGTQSIVVQDTTPPTIGAPGANATIECPAAPVFTPPSGSDDCGGIATLEEVSDVTTPGACLGTYTREKTWRFVDACGNASPTVSQTIAVVDTTPPNLGAPGANATIECPAVPVFTPPTAADDCSGTATIVEESDVITQLDCTAAGHVLYSRTKTWHAIDACGNVSASVSQTIDVTDTTAPTIGAPGANATVECPAVPVFTAPAVGDACGIATLVEESDVITQLDCTAAGHVLYSRTKTWHAIDACGNVSASVSQTIDVADTTAPTIGGQGADATIECTDTPSFTAPTAADGCGTATVVEASDVTTPRDCTAAGHVKYSRTKTWYAIDSCGNASAPVTQTIDVADTTPPSLLAPADVLGLPANELCAIPAQLGTPTFGDNCGLVVVTNDAPALFPIGTTMVTWTATDECGNVTTAQQRVQVLGRICISKWYDANANGINDKEPPIPGWKFVCTNLTDGTVTIGYTEANGRVCLDVSAGQYLVTEVAPSANWVATTPPISTVIDSVHCWDELAFGNYCFQGPQDGLSIAFWTSTTGKRYLGHNEPAWRAVVNSMNLRNADGTPFDVSLTAPPRVAIQSFQNWMLGANPTNMSYMLSAQAAATALTLQFRALQATQRIVVPGGVQTRSNDCVVSLLGTQQPLACGFPLLTPMTSPGSTLCGCASNDGTATVAEVLEWADCMLGAYPNTAGQGLSRSYAEALCALLDMINSNGNPAQGPYPCGGLTQYINDGPTACPVPPGY